MDNLRGIESFIKAVETGSIAAAARQIGISAAAASQNIARLETALGTRLLTRTTRRLALTDSGRVYYDRVRLVIQDLDHAQSAVSALHGRPQGRLRIASSVAFGREIIVPLIPGFCALYPDVSAEVTLSDAKRDHILDEIDVSIRFEHQLEPGLITRRLVAMPIVICASPDYLARKGKPLEPEDLKHHDCLVFRSATDGRLLRWGFLRNSARFEPELNAEIICNDIHALAALAVSGAGIARLGAFVADTYLREGRLVQLFPSGTSSGGGAQADAEPLNLYVCYVDRQGETPKVRAFIDYLISQKFEQWETR